MSTDGGKAWTTESARKISILNKPRQIPLSALIDTENNRVNPGNFKKRIQIIDFIFTQCPTACIGLGITFRQLQTDLLMAKMDKDVELISISFDVQNDSPDDVENYLNNFSARKDLWNGFVFLSEEDKNIMLDTFGVVVIPDDEIGYIHNTAIYLVIDGKLVELFDYDSKDKLMSRLISGSTG